MVQSCLEVISKEVPCLYSEGELSTTEFHCMKSFPLVLNLRQKRILSCQKFSLLRTGLFVLWGGWGERKRERAGHDFSLFPSCPARFLFFSIIAIFVGMPSGGLCGGESHKIASKVFWSTPLTRQGTHRQFSENICSKDNLRSRIFGAFAVKFLACLPLLGFSNI